MNYQTFVKSSFAYLKDKKEGKDVSGYDGTLRQTVDAAAQTCAGKKPMAQIAAAWKNTPWYTPKSK